MKILYLSCHEVLEYSELKLFTELGYECYSLGAYTQPGGSEHRKRPPLKLPYDPHFIELALQFPKEHLHAEQVEGIDAVIVMHEPKMLVDNWALFKTMIAKGKRIIWRSIGQSIPSVENKLRPMRTQGLEIVRYSPAEQTIEGNVGTDAVIRFYEDPDIYNGWTGSHRQVVNFTQSLKQRAEFCGYRAITELMKDLPAKVYGPGNEDLGLLSGGLLNYDEQLRVYRESRVFLYHGTYPASYTLSFIEAMMTGVPIVAVGGAWGNTDMFPNQRTYEIPAIIQDGVNGFVSDDLQYLRRQIELLLRDQQRAKVISTFGRATAIELFGKAKIKAQWKNYLEGGPQ